MQFDLFSFFASKLEFEIRISKKKKKILNIFDTGEERSNAKASRKLPHEYDTNIYRVLRNNLKRIYF